METAGRGCVYSNSSPKPTATRNEIQKQWGNTQLIKITETKKGSKFQNIDRYTRKKARQNWNILYKYDVR